MNNINQKRMKRILLLTLVCLGVTCSGVVAQDRNVTGRVTSAEEYSNLNWVRRRQASPDKKAPRAEGLH